MRNLTLRAACLGFAGVFAMQTAWVSAAETNLATDTVAAKAGQSTMLVIGPNMGLVGFDKADMLNGKRISVTTELKPNTRTVSRPRDAALDAHGALYLVSGANRGSIAVFEDPLASNGTRKPDRMVFGGRTLISRSPTGLALDRHNGLLYVSNTSKTILVFDISVPSSFEGNVAPLRSFDIDQPMFRPKQIRFANGSLYVVATRGGTADIAVFDQPAELSGRVAPHRVISSPKFDNRIGLSVDDKDRMLVAAPKTGKVLLFEHASTLDAIAVPSAEFTIGRTATKSMPSFAMFDSADRLYVADASGNCIHVFDPSEGPATGERTADRTIGSPDLIAPNRLLVFER